jgi:hypothetical protein
MRTRGGQASDAPTSPQMVNMGRVPMLWYYQHHDDPQRFFRFRRRPRSERPQNPSIQGGARSTANNGGTHREGELISALSIC